ncbi:hypothetical protein LIER_40743 [Lithospermum erythrorhizon]|uniref:Uncharacterized protein n=1 Tax=Lithospermum erythrorhizon TaxID=34254 RepID=A0AAV3R1Z4_LITER
MGTHAGGSRSHTRSSALIVDETGEMPSIAKRLRLQYGKNDNEGNPTEEMVNPTSKQVLMIQGKVCSTKKLKCPNRCHYNQHDLNDPTNLVDLAKFDMVDMTDLLEQDPVSEDGFINDHLDQEDELESIPPNEDEDDFDEDEEDKFFYLS